MIVALLTCHDRRDLTERALASLGESARRARVDVRVVLFDDGSSDGTAEAAPRALPDADVQVIAGDGSAFWARGMATAEMHALATAADDDMLLWLNDDVALAPDAIGVMLETAAGRTDAVSVGATVDPATGRINYGGYVRSGAHPLRFRHLDPDGAPQRIDTLNGNCVLVPVAAARRIGGIEGGFSHGLADIDYGLRANRLGIDVLLAPRPIGTCASHDPVARRPVLTEWRAFRSVKGGGHKDSMRTILRRTRPRTWRVYEGWSIAAWWLRAGAARLRA